MGPVLRKNFLPLHIYEFIKLSCLKLIVLDHCKKMKASISFISLHLKYM